MAYTPMQRHGLFLRDLRPHNLASDLLILSEQHASEMEEILAANRWLADERDKAEQEVER